MVSVKDINIERQRQHINISRQADAILEADALAFFGKKNYSGMINRIILNSEDSSEASIGLMLSRYREELHSVFGTVNDKAFHSMLQKLCDHFVEKQLKKMTSYPKGKYVNFRLSNDAYTVIFPDGGYSEECEYYGYEGAYIKALVEDYCVKTVYQRECIFLNDLVKAIELNIDAGNQTCLFNIGYETASGIVKEYLVKPHRLSNENETNSMYLIAMSKPSKRDEADYAPALFKLNRIRSIRSVKNSYGQGKLTKQEVTTLQDLIQKRGIYFLLNKEESVQLVLTPDGYRMYRNINYMRPVPELCEELEDGKIQMTFMCPKAHIKYYFFKFGKDVKIISPVDLARDFYKQYEEALSVYKEDVKW